MSDLSKAEIDVMINRRVNALKLYLLLNKIVKTEDEAIKKLFDTKTYQYLKRADTNFFWKSEENIVYLLAMELENNEEEWYLNA